MRNRFLLLNLFIKIVLEMDFYSSPPILTASFNNKKTTIMSCHYDET